MAGSRGRATASFVAGGGRRIVAGLVAGAAGTLALEAATYADMAIRGRPASPLPARSVDRFARQMRLRLGPEPVASARREGLGALFGHLTGLGVALGYAAVHARLPAPLRAMPAPLAGIGLGVAAMAASDVPLTVSGLTDPRAWGVSGWLEDIVPHVVYGLVTVSVHRAVIDVRTSHQPGTQAA